MTTVILAFGGIPANYVRSFLGALDITDGLVIHPDSNDDFVTSFEEMTRQLEDAYREYRGPRGDDPDWRRFFAARKAHPAAFIAEYFGVDEVAHVIAPTSRLMKSMSRTTDRAYAYIAGGIYSDFNKRIGYRWYYTPHVLDGNSSKPAIMEGHSPPGEKPKVVYELCFQDEVWATCTSTLRHQEAIKPPPRRAPAETIQVERWCWPIPMEQAVRQALSRILDERSRAQTENSYGGEIDTAPLTEELHSLFTGIG